MALTPFAEWLSAGGDAPSSLSTALISPELHQGGSRSLSTSPRGIPFSQLQSDAASAVAQAFQARGSTLAEVLDTRVCVSRSPLDTGGELIWTAGAARTGDTDRRSWPSQIADHARLFNFAVSPSWVIQGKYVTS